MNQKLSSNIKDWKWALFGKKKLESAIDRLRDENKRVEDVLPLMSVLSTSPNKTGKHRWHDSAISSPAAYQRLGLTLHDRLKAIISSDVTNIESLRLVDSLEEIPNATHDSFFARKPLTGLQRFKIMGEAGISDTVLVEHRTMD
jgi:hypothetical protein